MVVTIKIDQRRYDTGKTSFDRIMEQGGVMGFSMTYANNVLVTDSAASGSHQAHRSMKNEITVEMLNTGPDVLLGGGIRYWIPKEAQEKGYTLAFNKAQLEAAKGKNQEIFGLFFGK